MPDRSPTILLRVLFCTLVVSAFPVLAQPQYRVELLVFSNPGGGSAEQWDATPELAYPRRTQFLLPADGPATPTSTPLAAAATKPTAAAPATPAAIAAENLLPAPPVSIAFMLLSASQRELGASAAALQRSGRYHILFHEAWTQPIPGQAAAVPIVLDHSGDGGPWPALQGSIKIYQAGAFFVDTNLWLNTSGDYLPGGWRMPAPPRAPTSQAIEPTSPMEPGPQGVAGGTPLQSGAMPGSSDVPTATDVPATEPAAADYPYRHAVLLKQSRKMRAGQLNYIDHPLLGVLVKITPLTGAEPAPAPAPGST